MPLESQAWFVFVGSVFALMGLSLAGDAESHADSAIEWSGAAAGGRAGLTHAYRVAGLVFLAGGAALSACALSSPAALAARLKPVELGRGARLAAGLMLLAAGGGMAALKIGDWSRPRLPGGLEDEGLLDSPKRRLRGKAALLASWLLIGEVVLFSFFLLSRPGGPTP